MQKTNVPNIRLAFRYETLTEELNMLKRYSLADAGMERLPTPVAAPQKPQPDEINRKALQAHGNLNAQDMAGAASLLESGHLQQTTIAHQQQLPAPGSNAEQHAERKEANNDVQDQYAEGLKARQRRRSESGSSLLSLSPSSTLKSSMLDGKNMVLFPGTSLVVERAKQKRISEQEEENEE
jgi:hypothetical protein